MRRASSAPARAAESVEALRARGVVVLTKAQTAVALQVSYRTISRMMRRKEIPHFLIGGKRARFRIEEVLGRMAAGAEIRNPKCETPRQMEGGAH